MKNHFKILLPIVMLFLILFSFSLHAQQTYYQKDGQTYYQKNVATDTVQGVKFSSLPKLKQDSLRQEFAEHSMTVNDDDLVFFVKKTKNASVLQTIGDRIIKQDLPKGDLYLKPAAQPFDKGKPKKIIITENQ